MKWLKSTKGSLIYKVYNLLVSALYYGHFSITLLFLDQVSQPKWRPCRWSLGPTFEPRISFSVVQGYASMLRYIFSLLPPKMMKENASCCLIFTFSLFLRNKYLFEVESKQPKDYSFLPLLHVGVTKWGASPWGETECWVGCSKGMDSAGIFNVLFSLPNVWTADVRMELWSPSGIMR